MWWSMSLALAAPPEGTWQAGPEVAAVEDHLRSTVDALVRELSAPERPIARWLALRATRPCVVVAVETRGTEVAIRCDDQKVAIAPFDGTPVTFHSVDGRELTLVHTVADDGTVIQSFRGPHGARTTRLAVQPDGTLEVGVTIVSDALAEPLQYTLSYRPTVQGT